MSAAVAIEAFRPHRQHTLRGFARVRFPSGLILDEISVHTAPSGKAWAIPPARPQLDAEGRALRDERGKVKYSPLVAFASPEIRTAWSGQVIEAVRAKFPQALNGPLGENLK